MRDFDSSTPPVPTAPIQRPSAILGRLGLACSTTALAAVASIAVFRPG